MGTNTLSTAVDDQIIPALHHNELVEALLLDIVPRNASRVAVTDAGQLGTSLLRWLRIFVKEVLVGTSSNNLKIYEGALGELWAENSNGDSVKITDGQIQIWTDTVKRFAVSDAGIDWNTQTAASIPKDKVNGFIFSDYKVVNKSQGSGSATLYTTTALCLIFVEAIDFDMDTASSIQIAGGTFSDSTMLWENNSPSIQGYPTMVASGKALVWSTSDSSSIRIHIFEI